MSHPATFSHSRFPITAFLDAVPVSPELIDWLRARIEGFDSLDFSDLVVEPISNVVDFSAAFVTPVEFKIEPAGPTSFALLLDEFVLVRGRTGAGSTSILIEDRIRLRFPPEILRPADQQQQFVELSATPRVQVHWNDSDGINFTVDVGALSLSPAMIGQSGFIVSADNVLLSLVSEAPLSEVFDAGFGEGFQGVYIERATLKLPDWLNFASVSQLTCERCVVGTGGFSGGIQAHFNPSLVGASAAQPQHFEGEGAATLFGFSVGLQSISLDVRANRFSDSRLSGRLLLPLINGPIALDARLSQEGNAVAVTLTKDSSVTVNLPGARFQAGKLAATGAISSGDGFSVNGSLTDGIDLTFGNLLNFSAASASFDWTIDEDSTSLSATIDQLDFGPLGTLENARFNIEESSAGRVGSIQAYMRWENLRARLSVPQFLPAPEGGNVRATVTWHDNGIGGHRFIVRLSATIDDLSGLWSFLPADYRPQVEAAELNVELEYPDVAAFTAASSSAPLTGVVEVSVTVKLPMLPTLPGVATVTIGDATGRVRGTLRTVVDAGGQPRVSIVLTDPVTLDFRLPGSRPGAPDTRIDLDSISVANGDRPGRGTFGFSGSVSTPPIDTYLTGLVTQLGLPSGLDAMLRPLGQAVPTEGTFAFSVTLDRGNATPSFELVLPPAGQHKFQLLQALGTLVNPGRQSPAEVTPLPGLGVPSDFFEVGPGELRLSATMAAQPSIRISTSLDTTVFGETFDLTFALGVQQGNFDIALAAATSDPIVITAPIPDPVALLGSANVNAIAQTYGLNSTQRESLRQMAQAFTDLAADLGPQGVFAFEISNFGLNVTSAGPVVSGQVRLLQVPRFIEQLTPLRELRLGLGAETDKLFIEIEREGSSTGTPLVTVPFPGDVDVAVYFGRFMLAYAWGRNEFAFALDASIVPSRTLSVTVGGSGIFLPAIDTDVQLGTTVTVPPAPIPEGFLSFRRPLRQTGDRAVHELGLQAVIGLNHTRFVTAYLRELAFSPTYFLLWPGFQGDGGLVIGGPNPKDLPTADAYLNVRQWDRAGFFARFTVTRGSLIFFDAFLGLMLNPLAAVPPFITANPPYWIAAPFIMGDLYADEIGISLNIPSLVFINVTFERPLPSFSLQALLELAALAAGGFARPIPVESPLRKVFFAQLSAFVEVQLPGLSPANSSTTLTIEVNVADLINGAIDIMHKAKATLEAGSDLLNDITRDPTPLVRMVPRDARRVQHEITFGGFRLSGSVYLITPEELHDELRLFFENKRRRPRGIAANQPGSAPPVTTPVRQNPTWLEHVRVSKQVILDSRSLMPDVSVVAARSVKIATQRRDLNAAKVTKLTQRREQNFEEAATAVAGALAILRHQDAAVRRAALADLDLAELAPRIEAVFKSRAIQVTALTAEVRGIIVEAMRARDEAIVGESALPVAPEEIADTLIKRIVAEPPARPPGMTGPPLPPRIILSVTERTAAIDRLFQGVRPLQSPGVINGVFDRLDRQLAAAQNNTTAANRAIAEAKRQIASVLSDEFGFTKSKISALDSIYPSSATIAANIQSKARATWRQTPRITTKVMEVNTFNAAHFAGVLRDIDVFKPTPPDASDTVEAVVGYQIQTKDGSGGVAVPLRSGSAAYKVALENGRFRLFVRQRARTWVAHDLPRAFVDSVPSGPNKPALLRDKLVVAPRTVRRSRTAAERAAVQERFDQADTLYLTSILVRPEYQIKPTGGHRGPFYVADILGNGSGSYTVPTGVTLLGGFTVSLFGNELRVAGMVVADQQRPSVFLYGYSRLTCAAGGLNLVAEGQFVLSAGSLWSTIPLPSGAVTADNAIGFSGHVAVKRGNDTLFEGDASGQFSRAASGAVTAALKVQVSSEGSIDLGVADTEFARIEWAFSGELNVQLRNQTLTITSNATASISAELATYATRWVVDVPEKRVCVPWYYVDSVVPPRGHWGRACTTTPAVSHPEIDFSTIEWEHLDSAHCGLTVTVSNSEISFAFNLNSLGGAATETINRTSLRLSSLV